MIGRESNGGIFAEVFGNRTKREEAEELESDLWVPTLYGPNQLHSVILLHQPVGNGTQDRQLHRCGRGQLKGARERIQPHTVFVCRQGTSLTFRYKPIYAL